MKKRNYWDILIDDSSIEKEDLFLKIRDMYTGLMKHLYDDASDIPDFRIHFSLEQYSPDEGATHGYPIATVSRKSNEVTYETIRDVTQIENFEYSYTWYRDDVFVTFDFREQGISPFSFITHNFMKEVFSGIVSQGVRKMRLGMMNEYIISTGLMQFFYGFYHIDINFIQNLSATTYESSYADSRILVSRTDGRGVRRTKKKGLRISFVEPIDFSIENLRQIRKLLELSNDELALTIGETGKIRGLSDDAVFPNECEIRLHGHLSWTITYDGTKTISYNNGHYHIYVPHTADINLRNFVSSVTDPISDEQVESLSKIIIEASKQVHGTIVMLGSPEDVTSETERICDNRHAIEVNPVNLSDELNIITSLTAIDGAIFVDTDGICHCIGAILDGDLVAKGSMARGSRFNSTYNYVKRRADFGEHFTGIVISEDGTIDAINEDKVYRININRN